jgi:lambda repressor-like predicted transcriptional regulator
MRRVLATVLALLLLAVGLAAVAVAKPGKPKLRTSAAAVATARGGMLTTAATYLGVTRPELRAELRAGRSLAQVATAKGKSVDGLKASLLAALKTRVDAAVAAGRLEPTRAAAMLRRAPARIDRLVERTSRGKADRMRGHRGSHGLLRAAATYLGLERAALAAELRAGTSLAQVATANGKSVDGLQAALLAALKTKLDAAVAAGKLDPARAARMLERAPAKIERLVHRTRS